MLVPNAAILGLGFLGATYASLGAYTTSPLFILGYLRARVRAPLAELLQSDAAVDSPKPLSWLEASA